MNITTGEGRVTHLAVTHEIRREHDDSVISAHCCLGCAVQAFDRLSLGAMMGGKNQPGPLDRITAPLIDLSTGQTRRSRWGLAPLDGLPPAEIYTYPDLNSYPDPY